jgi:hypothetical protein
MIIIITTHPAQICHYVCIHCNYFQTVSSALSLCPATLVARALIFAQDNFEKFLFLNRNQPQNILLKIRLHYMFSLVLFLSPCFHSGFWSQGPIHPILDRGALCHLSHASSPFSFRYFSDSTLWFYSGQPWIMILLHMPPTQHAPILLIEIGLC